MLDFDKLNSDNYDLWQFRVKNALTYKKLWCHIIEEPKTTEEWKEKDSQALSIISLTCSDSVVHHILECKSAKQAWTILYNTFVRKTPAAKVSLYKELTNIKCDESAEVINMVEKFTTTVRKLNELNVTLDEEILVIMLLSALPQSFEHFVVSMETRDELPQLAELKLKIKEEFMRQGNITNETTVAMNIKHNNKSKCVCTRCGRSGHTIKQCYARTKTDKRNQHDGPSHNNNDDNNNNNHVRGLFATAMMSTNTDQSNYWILDSGATTHLCNNANMMFNTSKHVETIRLADGSTVQSKLTGSVMVRTKFGMIKIDDILLVPQLQCHFLSVNRAIEKGYEIIFRARGATIIDGDTVIATARKSDGLWIMNFSPHHDDVDKRDNGIVNNCNKIYNINTSILWHKRLGHLNYNSMIKMKNNNLVNGLKEMDNNKFECEICATCKITEQPYPKTATNRAKEILGRVHSDICGPMPKQSFGGAKYFITFIDDCSRYVKVYTLKSKSDAFDTFVQYKELMENQTGRKIKILRSDNGREYINNKFIDYFKKNGIKHETSVPHSPSQNGVAERMNRTLVEAARCMISDGQMPESSWAEAVSTAAYIRNRSESTSVTTTPFELMYKNKPSVSHLRKFGCIAIALKKGNFKRKFSPKGIKLRFVGYSTSQKGYRLIDTQSGRLTISRDVRFIEEQNSHVEIDDQSDEDDDNHNMRQQSTYKYEQEDEDEDENEYAIDGENTISPVPQKTISSPQPAEEKPSVPRRNPPRLAKAKDIEQPSTSI